VAARQENMPARARPAVQHKPPTTHEMAKAKSSTSSKGADKKAAAKLQAAALLALQTTVKSAQQCDASALLAPFLKVDARAGSDRPKMAIRAVDAAKAWSTRDGKKRWKLSETPTPLAAAKSAHPFPSVAVAVAAAAEELGQVEIAVDDEDSRYLMAYASTDAAAAGPRADADAENVDPKAVNEVANTSALLGFVHYR